MIFGGSHQFISGWRVWLLLVALLVTFPHAAPAQLFGERPPPVPPAPVPEAPAGPAISLAPSSGPASMPNLPAPLTQVPAAAVPLTAPLPSVAAPAQGVLSLAARYGKDLPVINSG